METKQRHRPPEFQRQRFDFRVERIIAGTVESSEVIHADTPIAAAVIRAEQVGDTGRVIPVFLDTWFIADARYYVRRTT